MSTNTLSGDGIENVSRRDLLKAGAALTLAIAISHTPIAYADRRRRNDERFDGSRYADERTHRRKRPVCT